MGANMNSGVRLSAFEPSVEQYLKQVEQESTSADVPATQKPQESSPAHDQESKIDQPVEQPIEQSASLEASSDASSGGSQPQPNGTVDVKA